MPVRVGVLVWVECYVITSGGTLPGVAIAIAIYITSQVDSYIDSFLNFGMLSTSTRPGTWVLWLSARPPDSTHIHR